MKMMFYPDEEGGGMHVYHAKQTCGHKVYSDHDEVGHFLVCSGCAEVAYFDDLSRLFVKTYTPYTKKDHPNSKGNGRLH